MDEESRTAEARDTTSVAGLALDSPRWAELEQAYGGAEDVPRLLAALGTLAEERDRAEVWGALWAMLSRGERTFSAAFAAAPHLLEAAAGRGLRERAQAVQLVASVEMLRHREGVPVPAELRAAYAHAVGRIPAMVLASAGEPWDADVARALASALLVAQRHPHLGLALLEAGAAVACPACGAEFVPGAAE